MKSFRLAFISLVLVFCGCGDDEIQLPDQELTGLVGGEEWTYQSANGFLISSDFQYRMRFLSDKEAVSDPCTLPAPTMGHVSAIFRPATGNFAIAPQALDNNQVRVTFEVSPSRSLTATNGFMEIFAIDNLVVVGYLQAVWDDDNSVEGFFEIRLCN